MERTLSIIKPDGVAQGLIGEVIKRLENAGLKIVAAKMIHLTKKMAEGFYAVHRGKGFYDSLTDFMSSYQFYDQAVKAASETVFATNGISTPAAGEVERQADTALSNLQTKSSVQISSLIKNENEAMRTMREIADLSDKEMSTLKAYQQTAVQDVDRDALAQAFYDLAKQRQAAFAHFQELGR